MIDLERPPMMTDPDRDTYVAWRTVKSPDTWADTEGQFVHGGMYFRRARLVSPLSSIETVLKVTLFAARDSDDGLNRKLSKDEKNQVIHEMIDQLDGAQDVAMGTVVIPIPLEKLDGITVQLWIHEWE